MATSAVAAAAARARRDIQHHFFSNDAVRPDRAVDFEPRNRMQRRQFERMHLRGIIQQSNDGRYWLDVVAYDVDLRRRHRILKNVLFFVIAALVVVLLSQPLLLG